MFTSDEITEGQSHAQFCFGQIFATGLSVEQSYAQAYRRYHKAAVTGHFVAQYELGLMYASGLGVTQNTAKAAAWYKKSAIQGYSEAQLALGKMYLSGNGVPRADEQAYYWLSKAASQGDCEALLQLWNITEQDISPPGFELDAMISYYELDDLDDPDVQFWLGIITSCFIYSQSDLLQPATWFSKAAKRGHRAAQYRLAIHYAIGLGVSQSSTKAAFWYHQAATQGSRPTEQQF